MNASHTQGVHVFAAFDLVEALTPVLLHGSAIGHIVETSLTFHVPLAHIVAEHGLTMAGANNDSAAVGHFAIAGHLEESLGAFVHGWPQGIGTQTQQQFKNLAVGLRSYAAFLARRLKGLCGPWAQAPVFVVDENATILHAGGLTSAEVVGHREELFGLGLHVAPPYPRRHAGHARELQQSVGGATGRVALHQNLLAGVGNGETVGLAMTLGHHDGGLMTGLGHQPCHLQHVVAEHADRHLQHLGTILGNAKRDGMLSVEPCQFAPRLHRGNNGGNTQHDPRQ